jgi:hypothetical protein
LQKFTEIALEFLASKLGAAATPTAVSGLKKLFALVGTEGGIHH